LPTAGYRDRNAVFDPSRKDTHWGKRKLKRDQFRAAKVNADSARQRAKEAAREADRAEAHAWSLRMEGFGGRSPRQQSRNVSMAGSAGLRWSAIAVRRAPAYRSMQSAGRGIHLSWKLEAALKCRSCRKGRYAPPVHMTETREITPYLWVHPDEER